MSDSINCFVYKGGSVDDHYLYLPAELSDQLVEQLPQGLISLLGQLSFVVEFELNSERVLAQVDAAQVINSIESSGYFLQMPNKDRDAQEDRFFS